MKGTVRRLRQAREDDRGASLVEYALLVALIAVIAIAAVTTLGDNASGKFDETATGIGASAGDTPENNCPGTWPDEHYIASDPGTPYRGVPMHWEGPGWYDGGPSYDLCSG